MAEASKAVLITGCSSGIGHATAEHLAARGWTVYASARRTESIADLAERGCKTLALDVTDEGSMRAAVAEVEEAEGAVGALVNNAGYSQSGAIETLPLERLRAQFETNVFGLVRMCQLVLPGMRRQGCGTDRERQLDGRPAHLPRRRRLPRDQARGRGALGRSALRGAWLRRPRGRDRAGADHDALRRDRRGLGRRRRDGGRRPVRGVQRRRQHREPRRSTRDRWRASAEARRPSPGRSSGRSPRGGRRPATR